MTALVALASALLIGSADFAGGLAARRDSPLRVTLWTQLTSFATAVALVGLVAAPAVTRTDLVAGAVAGLSGAFSFVAFYGALGRGVMGVVAPTTAVVGASVPALIGVARGEHLSLPTSVGLVVAVVAIVLVTRSGDQQASGASTPPVALVLAVVAGLGFSIFFVALGETSGDAGLWPLVVARVVSVPLVAVTARVATGRVGLAPEARGPALGAGVIEMLANVLLLYALRWGPLAVASVFGSLYPVSTVLLARRFLHERLAPTQVAGVGVATLALALVAL
ncbi:MAG: EamA family transporter [Actinomyces sp.]|nr:MAG: EamA family transporter [Actinomyces sp.]